MVQQKTKVVDSRGRLTLGQRFAGRAVIVRELADSTIVVELARTIPESEAWLYESPEAIASVRRGLVEAREGMTRPLDLEALEAVADRCEDE